MICDLTFLSTDGQKFLHQCARCGKIGRYKNRDPKRCKQQCDSNPVLQPLPGYEFHRITVELGVKRKCGDKCAELEREMNAAGVSGCRERRDYFLAKLRDNAKSYGLADWAAAGWNAVIQGKPRSLEGLFDLAIERAAKIEQLLNHGKGVTAAPQAVPDPGPTWPLTPTGVIAVACGAEPRPPRDAPP